MRQVINNYAIRHNILACRLDLDHFTVKDASKIIELLWPTLSHHPDYLTEKIYLTIAHPTNLSVSLILLPPHLPSKELPYITSEQQEILLQIRNMLCPALLEKVEDKELVEEHWRLFTTLPLEIFLSLVSDALLKQLIKVTTEE